MDDDFMTVCLADNFEGVELILQIVLGKKDIKIKSVRTQEVLKNLEGRSATLDVHAIDSDNKEFDVEIQRKDAGAGAKKSKAQQQSVGRTYIKEWRRNRGHSRQLCYFYY